MVTSPVLASDPPDHYHKAVCRSQLTSHSGCGFVIMMGPESERANTCLGSDGESSRRFDHSQADPSGSLEFHCVLDVTSYNGHKVPPTDEMVSVMPPVFRPFLLLAYP